MVKELETKNILEKKDLQFNTLLEITQSISRNVSEESLYKIFYFTLRSNLHMTKLALFVWGIGGTWHRKACFGMEDHEEKMCPDDIFNNVKDISPTTHYGKDWRAAFDTLVPVMYEKKTLALIFLGHHHIDADHLNFIQLLGNIIIVAIENKRLAKKELKQLALRRELEIAGDVQQFLFPKKLPYTDTLKIQASYLPHNSVGGDYYDYVPIDEHRFLLCIADVSGKGIPAALVMSNFQASLRTMLLQTDVLPDIVHALNYRIMESTQGEKFITFFGAIYDAREKTLRYVNAGHNPAYFFAVGQDMRSLREGSPVLGAVHPLPFLNQGIIKNISQFSFFAYTDGITETSNPKGEHFGQKRLLKYLISHLDKDLRTIHQDLIIMLDDFKGGQSYSDDITMLSCRVR